MFDNILVATDGSKTSREAERLALRLAKAHGASVLFIHVVETPKFAVSHLPFPVSIALRYAREEGSRVLDRVRQLARRIGVGADRELLEGPCVGSILNAARRRNADLIVMGSHGESGLRRVPPGSIAEGVLRGATQPVLITRGREPIAAIDLSGGTGWRAEQFRIMKARPPAEART